MEVLDYETAGRPEKVVVLSGQDILPYDHLHWRHLGAWRDGIVTGTTLLDKDVTAVEVIRYGYDFPRMVVTRETFTLDLRSDVVSRYAYGQYCHPPSVVQRRSEKCRLAKWTGYNALRNNNEDFCRWCKSGKQTYTLRDEFQLAGLEDKDDLTEVTDWLGIVSWDEAALGDHIAWRSRGTSQLWRHGILVSCPPSIADAEVVTASDGKCALVSLNCRDIELNRVLYRSCHASNFVRERARSMCDSDLATEDTLAFAKWCKTGVPMDSAMTEVVMPRQEGQNVLKQEVVETVSRGGSLTVFRGAAGEVVKQSATTIARGAVEGAVAAAVVGVEALVVGIEVGLAYKSFKRNRISKDELNRRNIVTVVRSTSAAGLGIGGMLAGAAAGSVVPIVGTVVGGIIGGVAGGIGGQVVGHFSGQEIARMSRRPYDNCCVDRDADTPAT